MIRRVMRTVGLMLVTVLFAACGGGGGGGGSGAAAPTPPVRNQITDSTGRLTLAIDSIILSVPDDPSTPANESKTGFSVTLLGTNKAPLAGRDVLVTTSDGSVLVSYGQNPTNQDGRATGTLSATSTAVSGLVRVTVSVPQEGLSVFMNIRIVAVPATPTPTPVPGQPTATLPPGAPTRTPLPASLVRTIVMETSPFTVSSTLGGTLTVTAIAFDEDNQPVNDVEILFDFTPKQGLLRPPTAVTRTIDGQPGVAQTTVTYEPNTATPGQVTVTAVAGSVQGSITFEVVSGNNAKPVATLLLQSSCGSIGTENGGQTTLSAVVFDGDNNPINDVNVLFLSPVGEVIPLTARTGTVGNQQGVARTTLTIPAGTAVLSDGNTVAPYVITARAGGVTASANIFVLPGRTTCPSSGGGQTEEGEVSSITLGASPTRVRARSSGGRELSSISATVFDNGGNRLQGAEVTFSVATPSASGAVLVPNNDGTLTQTTDAAGNAQIQMRSGAGLGTVTIEAEVPADPDKVPGTEACQAAVNQGKQCIIARRPLVTVTSGSPGRVSLTINDAAIDLNDGARLTTVSAIITDAQGNIVDDGTPAFFEIVVDPSDPTDPGLRLGIQGFSSTNEAPPCDVNQFNQQTGIPVTPEPGDAITCLKFPPGMAGSNIRVRAESQGAEITDTLTLPGFVPNLLLSVQPKTAVVTASNSATVLASVDAFDFQGNGVRNVQMRFLSDVGSFDDGAIGLTDANGHASVPLTIPAGTDAGAVTIQALGGGILGVSTTLNITNEGGGGPAGTPQSIDFVSATPATIGVRGSGFPQQSVVSFRVVDSVGTPLSGVVVHFSITGIGGETITPTSDATDGNGIAQVTINSGTRSAPVRITASASRDNSGSVDIVTQSDAVTVVGAPPTYNRFSLAAQFVNIAGRVTFGLEDKITAFLNDRFGNAVSVPTAVSFVTNGASIVNPQPTDSSGRASGTLQSEGKFLGLPPSGIVTTLATTRGEEPFVDTNGNGVYDVGEPFTDIPEPFIDYNGNGKYDPPEPFTDTNGNGRWDQGEPFTDTNGNGQYDDNRFELFIDVNGNGVWDAAQSPNEWQSDAVIFATIDVTFSANSLVLLDPQTFTIPDGGSQTFSLFVGDVNSNPLVGGSTISVSLVGSDGRIVGIPSSIRLPDAESFNAIIPGLNQFQFQVVDNNPGKRTETQPLTVNVSVQSDGTSGAGGNGSVFASANGVLEAAATPVPTSTPTATPIPTATVTPPPLVIAPSQATLAGGSGAPPTSCNGATQTFIVSGGTPPYTVFGGGGCISTSTVSTSGGSFIFTAGDQLGNFTVTVTDAQSKTASAGVTVLGPPTPTITPTLPPTNTPLPTNTPPPTATFTVTPTATATLVPASIQFINAAPASIGVRQSGLSEQSLLTFKLTDALGNPVANFPVEFELTGIGDETTNPLAAMTNAAGLVQTTLTSGTRATTVRVTARADSDGNSTLDLSAQSTAVAILGAPPVQNRFSLAAEKLNVQGRKTLGLQDTITAFVNDRFGNAVPPGTVVSFTSNGASVVNPAATNSSGAATVTLVTEAQIPPTGIVQVLAFTRGEEQFLDNNGNGIFDQGTDTVVGDNLPEPFIDFRPLPPLDAGCPVAAPSASCNNLFDPSTLFELFIDSGPKNGLWDTQGTSGAWDNNILVFGTVPVTFSGDLQTPTLTPNGFTIPNGGAQSFSLEVHDDLLNPLVGGSTVTVSATKGQVIGGSITIPDGESFNQLVSGLTLFNFTLADGNSNETDPAEASTVTVTVTSPNGSGSFILASGTVD